MRSATLIRASLAVFVLAWLFGPRELRGAVPIWIPFLVALGLELQFFVSALRAGAPTRRTADRGPQPTDLEELGYEGAADELALVRRGGEEVWIPYAGETAEELDELADEALAAASPERPSPAPLRTRRRPLRRFAAGVATIGALVVLVLLVERKTGWDALAADSRAKAVRLFSDEASRIAGHAVTIRCDEAGDYVGVVQHADGVAEVGGRVAYLTPVRCLALYRLAFEDDVRFAETARAIAVLAHEAWHLRGVRNEGVTECYALQSGVELGQRLGLSPRTASQMMRQQLVENALRRGRGAEYVVPRECRDGGRLDLHPERSRFP